MPLLRVEDVTVMFGDFRALDSVTLDIEEGRTVAIVGPNGAGKTTLVNVITGYVTPAKGRVYYMEHDITRLPPWTRARMGIVRAFQLPRLFWKQSVLENVAAAIVAREKLETRFFADTSSVEQEALKLLRLVGLEDKAHLPVRSLSAGERKVLDALLALALHPRLLILDEPTSGVASEEKRSIMETMLGAARRMGATIVFVEHDMEIVEGFAERVVAVIAGRIAADGSPSEVLRNPLVREHLGLE